jgi:cysteine desulfurase
VIYLDHHATTPIDPAVLKEMMPFLTDKFGNASSATHVFGREAATAVKKARFRVARLIGADPKEIIFTSGATEANNLAIKGVAEAYRKKGRHIVTVGTEHKSVLDPCKRLALSGWDVTFLPVKPDGIVDLEVFRKALKPQTILVSVMLANNEIGVIQPIAQIAKITQSRGIILHCDGAQAVGKIPVNVRKLGVDLLSLTAHKIYGPKGVGALYLRKSQSQVKLLPLFDGGGQEGGFRSGTLNVAGIVGFGKACEIAGSKMKTETPRLKALRNRLRDGILRALAQSVVHGSQIHRLPNNLNIGFPGVHASELMARLNTVALSSGSACLSTSPQVSHVLKALGVEEGLARGSVRFGVGRFNTQREIDAVVKEVVKVVKYLTLKANPL